MSGFLLGPIISSVINVIGKVIPDVNTQNRIREALVQGAIEGDLRGLEAQGTIIANEAASDSWLTSSFRPICMLTFLAMIVSAWFGFVPDHLPSDMINRLFDLLQLGLGGYIAGRSVEKIATTVSSVFKK